MLPLLAAFRVQELGKCLTAVDAHGHVSQEQFVEIVAAEQLIDPDSDAHLLMHLAHARPNWWSDMPRSLDV